MKNKLGKVTFASLCAFLGLYALYNIYGLWTLIKMMISLELFSDLSNASNILDFMSLNIVINWFVGPMICWMVFLLYTIIIGRGKKVKPIVYIITASAILCDLIFGIVCSDIGYDFLSALFTVIFRAISCAYIVILILLFVNDKKDKLNKIIKITVISTYICALINEVAAFTYDCLRQVIIFEEIDFNNICSIVLWHGNRFLVVVILGLVLGYILYPEKYLITEQQELCSENEAV